MQNFNLPKIQWNSNTYVYENIVQYELGEKARYEHYT